MGIVVLKKTLSLFDWFRVRDRGNHVLGVLHYLKTQNVLRSVRSVHARHATHNHTLITPYVIFRVINVLMTAHLYHWSILVLALIKCISPGCCSKFIKCTPFPTCTVYRVYIYIYSIYIYAWWQWQPVCAQTVDLNDRIFGRTH